MSAREIDEYLSGVEEPERGTLEALRRMILEIVPDAEQVISYRVPAFRVGGQTVAGFAAFKDYLSYLPFSGSVLGQLADELDDYTMTKSSLHFTPERPPCPRRWSRNSSRCALKGSATARSRPHGPVDETSRSSPLGPRADGFCSSRGSGRSGSRDRTRARWVRELYCSDDSTDRASRRDGQSAREIWWPK